MKRSAMFHIIVFALAVTALLPSQANAQGNPSHPHFLHVATKQNTNSHLTLIDNPLINNNPNAILLVTQNWNPGGQGGVYNPHPIAVTYTANGWAIFNEDFQPMPIGAAFNVVVWSPYGEGQSSENVQLTSANNVLSNADDSLISNSQTNSNPGAMMFITQVWDAKYAGKAFNPHPIGALYTG